MFLRRGLPELLAWHRYLATARDPEGSGLVTIYHPWESGTDNSPRWNVALEVIEVGELPPTRADLQHVDPSERPTNDEYDRYLWLVEVSKPAIDDAVIYPAYPFLIKDVLASAILVPANEALLQIAEIADAPAEEREAIPPGSSAAARARRRSTPASASARTTTYARNDPRGRTVAGFAPLVAGGERPDHLGDLLRIFDSRAFAGNPDLRWPLPPSTSPGESGFQPRSYWRGPMDRDELATLVVVKEIGEKKRAARLKSYSLAQLLDGCFGECYEPFTGEALGSDDQSVDCGRGPRLAGRRGGGGEAMTYRPIQEYGIIGNMRTAALVGRTAPSTGSASRTSTRRASSRPSWTTRRAGASRYRPKRRGARQAALLAETNVLDHPLPLAGRSRGDHGLHARRRRRERARAPPAHPPGPGRARRDERSGSSASRPSTTPATDTRR